MSLLTVIKLKLVIATELIVQETSYKKNMMCHGKPRQVILTKYNMVQ